MSCAATQDARPRVAGLRHRGRAWAALVLVALLALAGSASQAAEPTPAGPTPVGIWRTFDDADGIEKGVVTITEKDGILTGAVTGILDPAKRGLTCERCTDDRRDKPLMGMEIIRGMKRDGDVWDGGEILDPNSGKIYRAKMRLEDGGNTLKLRGFIGISLLGRTQTWRRR